MLFEFFDDLHVNILLERYDIIYKFISFEPAPLGELRMLCLDVHLTIRAVEAQQKPLLLLATVATFP